MRTKLIPLTLVAVVGLTGVAMAATVTDGIVKSFDLKKHTLTLESGIVYMLPQDFINPGLNAGQRVAVTWDMNGGQYDASKVVIQKVSQ